MKIKDVRSRKVWFTSIVLALCLLLAACGSGNNGGSNAGGAGNGGTAKEAGAGQGTAQADKPVEIRIMSHFLTATPPAKDNPVELKIEELTGAKLNIEWVSGNNYTDKLNVTLASGDLPELLFINDPFSTTYRLAAEQGAFWNIADFIGDYPNLAATISDIAWELTKINGESYGIPRPRPAESDSFFVIRKDWLDRLGLAMPTTTEQLKAVMQAFVEQDPDQNGQKDTYAFAGFVNPQDMGNMGNFESIFTGANGLWKDVDGELVFTALLPETREALVFLAEAYQAGQLPEDFASLQLSQANDLFKAGKAGMTNEKAGAFDTYFDRMKELIPELEMTDLVPLTTINGYNPKGPGFAGVNVIPKSVPEAKVRQILSVYDRWVQEDVFELHRIGIEGTHHKVENGEIVIDTEKTGEDAISSYNQIVYVADPYASSIKDWFPQDAQDLYRQVQDERAKSSVADVSIGLYSETALTYRPELYKNLQDIKTKVILGTSPIAEWDRFVDGLKNNGDFAKMAEEMNAAFQSR